MKCLSVWCKQKVCMTWIHINHRLNYHRFCQYMPDTDSFTCTCNARLFWVQFNPDKCIYLVSEAFPVCSFFLFKWIFIFKHDWKLIFESLGFLIEANRYSLIFLSTLSEQKRWHLYFVYRDHYFRTFDRSYLDNRMSVLF